MTGTSPRVIVIPPKPELARSKAVQRQLRVAAYCRVSTDDEEQLTSYEAQQNYYTDKIMTNPQWTMAGVFADEGISGTSASKRPAFLRMIRQCRQGKIDLVLVKSISRFARNTVDCLNYIRTLRAMGIAVVFEKENINTLESDSEILITMMGAFAQAESESMSGNISWGKRQAMKEGKVVIHYKNFYGYEKGGDGKPRIIPEQAEVIRKIYDSFLAGYSVRMIKAELEAQGVPATKGGTVWSESVIRGILKNEKYCGDALMQKTFIQDCISKKQLRNRGQLPMYLKRNNHEGIVSRDTFNAVRAEFARRNAGRAPSQKLAPTGRSCYSAKYALTERLGGVRRVRDPLPPVRMDEAGGEIRRVALCQPGGLRHAILPQLSHPSGRRLAGRCPCRAQCRNEPAGGAGGPDRKRHADGAGLSARRAPERGGH